MGRAKLHGRGLTAQSISNGMPASQTLIRRVVTRPALILSAMYERARQVDLLGSASGERDLDRSHDSAATPNALQALIIARKRNGHSLGIQRSASRGYCGLSSANRVHRLAMSASQSHGRGDIMRAASQSDEYGQLTAHKQAGEYVSTDSGRTRKQQCRGYVHTRSLRIAITAT